ncbi:hypothetical protein DVH24_006970 [Malus domestica]|uniref:Uncharacterized protein n=1 Tax=Malus domestica TaxID=3750 RepID=A0A498I6N0_MALDO|nr:hypothetical protein DVH24_006970 [Malus domestica]
MTLLELLYYDNLVLLQVVKTFIKKLTPLPKIILNNHHINMRNNFQRPRFDPYSNFYNPSWPEHQNPMWEPSHHLFGQPIVLTNADWENAIENMAKSFENNHRVIQDAQAPLDNLVQQVGQLMHQWGEHEEDKFPCQQIDGPQDSEEWCENAIIEEQFASYSCPMEEKAHVDPEISTKPFIAQVYMPHIPHQEAAMQPTKLQESFETSSTHIKPIIITEIKCRSIKQAKAYGKKNTFCSSQMMGIKYKVAFGIDLA